MESIADTEVHPGQVLAGKFRIESVLGRGGMGVVVAATHLQLDEKVALKFLLPEALKNAEAVRRFEREARAAVKIKSEHVARVTDVGKLETGAPYMVMEFLHGMDLGQYLQNLGPLPLEEAVEYLLQAVEAIAEAHSLGIVHRDLKPANLYRILRSDGSPSIKVLDFGISKVTTGDDASMTHTSSMMGSPYYMSPEQMTSAKNVDQRTDVWALGIILHELLTGNVPYDGETIPEVCAKVLQNPPPELALVRPDLPPELNRVLEKALQKKREDRYSDVAQFAVALAAFANLDGRRSAERISKVLGVTLGSPDARFPDVGSTTLAQGSTQLTDRFGSPPLSAVGINQETARKTAADPITLDGAAHTHLDYQPPTSGPSRKALFVSLAAFLLLGIGVLVLVMGKSPSTDQESLVVTDSDVDQPETTAPPEKTNRPDGATEAPLPTGNVKDSTVKDSNVKDPVKPAIGANTTAPVPATRTTSAAQTARAAKPATVSAAPRPSAAPAPATQPAPATKPAPAPSPANLYLDRR